MELLFANDRDREMFERLQLLHQSSARWVQVDRFDYLWQKMQTLGWVIALSRGEEGRPKRGPGIKLTDAGRSIAERFYGDQ